MFKRALTILVGSNKENDHTKPTKAKRATTLAITKLEGW